MTNLFRGLCLRVVSAIAVTAGFVLAGCAEPEPPPMSKETIEATKVKQEQMLKKEYGLDQKQAK